MALPDFRNGLVEIRYHHVDEDIHNISQLTSDMIEVHEGRTYDRPTYALSYKFRREEGSGIFSAVQKSIIKTFVMRVCELQRVHSDSAVVLWVDKVYTKNTPNGQLEQVEWYMHGLMPYTRFDCVRIDDFQHRESRNYSGWMRIEAAVANKVGRVITFDRNFRYDNYLFIPGVRTEDPAKLLRRACEQIDEQEESFIMSGEFYIKREKGLLKNVLHPDTFCKPNAVPKIMAEEWNTFPHMCGWSEEACLQNYRLKKDIFGNVNWTVVSSAGRYCFASAPLSNHMRVVVDLGNNRCTDRELIHVYAFMISSMSRQQFETTFSANDRVVRRREPDEIKVVSKHNLHLNFA